ncbi:hypothetical protein GCM10018782_49750 [Streptomyces griseoaurantiacus]|nr:hypothetical protein GCM10018782_49750 [Streptomyces griseoaurantiacus]
MRRRAPYTGEPPYVTAGHRDVRGLSHGRRRRGPEPDPRRIGTGPVPDQYTWTPYAFRASVTGWKKVVPPEEQLPLPPEVRP